VYSAAVHYWRLDRARCYNPRLVWLCPLNVSVRCYCLQARVSVVDPLPLVRARIETPPTSVAPSTEQPAATPSTASPDTAASAPKAQDEQAAIETVKASALKGQILGWWLSISNIGRTAPPLRHQSSQAPVDDHGCPARIAHSTDYAGACILETAG
jgi:hypothetical protein